MRDRARGQVAATSDPSVPTEPVVPGQTSSRRRVRVSHTTVVAYLALFFAMSGTAVAATGGTFILGKSNAASTVTSLTNSEGTALVLRSPAGTAPLAVNRTVRVKNLNADMVDGKHASDFVSRARFDKTQLQFDEAVARIAELETLLAGVTRADDSFGRDTLTLAEMNVQVVNGTGTTDGTPNGLGNLIVGYNLLRPSGGTTAADRVGSHALIIGDRHHWTSFGHLLAGLANTASGARSSVSGGYSNTASGHYSSVSGGVYNAASGQDSSVSGGDNHTASGASSSVSGGNNNIASGASSSVSGGNNNIASGILSSVLGGYGNTASGFESSVSGGYLNNASGMRSSVLGGNTKTVSAGIACHPSCA
jgi:hypothetical protein